MCRYALLKDIDVISFHFYCIDIAKKLHSLASIDKQADICALRVCEKDITLLKKVTKIIDGNFSCPTATIACIILEKNKEYQKAIDLCEFLLSETFANETYGTTFEKRRDKLLKKINS